MTPLRSASSRRLRLPGLALAAGLLGSVLLVSPVLPEARAQDASQAPAAPKPPLPGKEDDSRPYLTAFLLMILLAAGVIGVNLIPSKRGHQD